jgi:hypothetical protein
MGVPHDQPTERSAVRRHYRRSRSTRLGTPGSRGCWVHNKYGLKRLVYAEWHDDILAAKQREMNIKHWPRAWKIHLIHRQNPFWEDRYDNLL